MDSLWLGKTNWRDTGLLVGLGRAERLYHLYVIGQTGAGKSTLLASLMRQDAICGQGFAFLDPHGDAVAEILGEIARREHVGLAYLDAPDSRCHIGFNPLEAVQPNLRLLAASGILEAFRSVWDRWWGPRLEHYFRNALLTLLDQREATLADVPRLFMDERFRRAAIQRIGHPVVREFWVREYERMPLRYRAEAVAPLLNKLGAFLSQPPLYRILTAQRSSFDIRQIMDEGKVLLVNLAKGRMGTDACSLLGSLLVSRIALAGLSRADMPDEVRRPFFVYLDEFQSFTTVAFASMLSELRKYGVGLILAHQYLDQLDPQVRSAVLGNVGTIVTFRIGPEDVGVIGKYFAPEAEPLDLLNLPNYNAYVRLMADGEPVRPFSFETLPPHWRGDRRAA